eukprot:UN28718
MCNKHDHCPRLLILNSPSNPHGQRYTSTEFKDLAEVCRKHRILVVSDEIYSRLHFFGEDKHCSMAEHYPEGTVVLTGISKWAGAGGWRLGAFSFPKELQWLVRSMNNIASETFYISQ